MNAKQLKDMEAEDAIARGVYASILDRDSALLDSIAGEGEAQAVQFHGDRTENVLCSIRSVHNLRKKWVRL